MNVEQKVTKSKWAKIFWSFGRNNKLRWFESVDTLTHDRDKSSDFGVVPVASYSAPHQLGKNQCRQHRQTTQRTPQLVRTTFTIFPKNREQIDFDRRNFFCFFCSIKLVSIDDAFYSCVEFIWWQNATNFRVIKQTIPNRSHFISDSNIFDFSSTTNATNFPEREVTDQIDTNKHTFDKRANSHENDGEECERYNVRFNEWIYVEVQANADEIKSKWKRGKHIFVDRR